MLPSNFSEECKMSSLNLKERFNQASLPLCTSLSTKILKLPDNIKEKAQEIRLRLNRPVAVCCPDNTYFITENGCITNKIIDQPMLCTYQRDMADIFHNIFNSFSHTPEHRLCIPVSGLCIQFMLEFFQEIIVLL